MVASVKQHLFHGIHEMLDGQKRRFIADQVYADWWTAAAKGTLGDLEDQFRAFLAHEFVESCLMKSGVPFRVVDNPSSIDELGAHDLAPHVWKLLDPWFMWKKHGLLGD